MYVTSMILQKNFYTAKTVESSNESEFVVTQAQQFFSSFLSHEVISKSMDCWMIGILHVSFNFWLGLTLRPTT